jgi:hypothetical protein
VARVRDPGSQPPGAYRILLGFLRGGDDGHEGAAKVLSLWNLVQAAGAQRLAPAVLSAGGVPCGQQAGEPAQMVWEEPGLFSR